jgi:polyadenylate-binding protein
MRDSNTGKSRGYAFVNFVNARDADAAKLYAQYEKLGNKRIRIMFKRNIREIPTEGNVHVKNIDPSIDVKRLHEFFNEQGMVVSAKISEDKHGNSLGYGYVQYDKQEDAEKAIQTLNGKTLGEKELIVEKFVKKQDRLQSVDKKNLYIKNLPVNISKEEVEKLVRDTICKGAVISSYAAILKDGKWAAFACLEDAKAAEEIVERYKEPTKLPGVEEDLCVVYHESKQERIKKLSMQHQKETNETNLYVKNLNLNTKKEELFNAFIQFGPITSVDVKLWNSPNGKQAVFGFINFKSKEDATRARSEALSKDEIKKLYIPTEPQYINLHQSKDKRNEFIQSKKRAKNSLTPFMPAYRFDPYMQFQGMNNNRRFGPYTANLYPPRQGGQQQRGPMHSGMNRPGGDQQRFGQQQQRGGFQKQQQPYGNRPQQGTRPPMGGNMVQNKPYNNPNGNFNNQKKQDNPIKQTQPKPQTQQQQAPQSTASVVNVASLRSKLNDFLGQTQDKQRQILGELLFPKVRSRTTEVLAPKITGMLIDLSVLEVTEILEFLEDETLLSERISEAKELIESGEAN